MAETQNYTLGRGKVYFSRFKTGTRIPAGFKYIGNTPEFSLTIEAENLDHFSSDEGIREKDDSVPLEVTRTGSLTTDSIRRENIAYFFFGSSETVVQSAVVSAPESFSNVSPGTSLKVGITNNNPTGYFGITVTTVTSDPAGTTYVLGTDYTVTGDMGLINILEDGAILEGDDIIVTFAVEAKSRDRIVSGSEPVEGAMMYEAKNPKGRQYNYFLPYVKVTPNGDYNLKGDEWQTLPLSIEVLKPENGEAIYVDGTPFTP
jgi:hypothetical protein